MRDLGKIKLAPSALIRMGKGLIELGYNENDLIEVEAKTYDDAENKDIFAFVAPDKKGQASSNEIKLSETEQALYDLIVAKGEVTIRMIEDNLSKKHIGAIGKLIQRDRIEKSKKRPADGSSMKFVTYYTIKKEKQDDQ